MSKKDFIALADLIRKSESTSYAFNSGAIENLAVFCKRQNPAFNRERWLDYIAGKCGPCGGVVNVLKRGA